MAAAVNGMALSKVRPFGATFFVFIDYLRPSIRLGAIGQLPVIYVFTHDSIGLGEDGPTHQPIEHLAAARAIPERGHPSSRRRQRSGRGVASDHADHRSSGGAGAHAAESADARSDEVRRGRGRRARGAMCWPTRPGASPSVILMATGSEVSLCVAAHEQLRQGGDRGPRGEHAVLGVVRGARRRPIATACCRRP